ncbi:hypothetical protein FRZ67_16125 [Panacibacter ginsenosidivorans]|uniref:Uncharacterized protein n=1 Tax=Panacibacter ginsenosidivorans TaxID=1813871 RepID=A0A5B8VDN5_9BACT|nr:hypothetical protein [Panacibacter ginsenosidivorans]QEC68756.1 hypothetical protein FRZ67_16125 [Panacibacter ginsenosidivorans]
MKNTIKTFTVIAAMFLVNYNATAQTAASNPYDNTLSLNLQHANATGGDEEKNSHVFDNIHPRALENFQKSFKDVSSEKWTKNGESYFASFTKDSVFTRVDYNKKGRWLETIRYYDQKKLPGDANYMIKKGYSDYSVLGVAEVSFDDVPVYLVHIQNESHFKIVGIYEGEMTEVESHKRW